jgi:hypothetical protein
LLYLSLIRSGRASVLTGERARMKPTTIQSSAV